MYYWTSTLCGSKRSSRCSGRVDIKVVGKATSPMRALELIDEFVPELFVTGVHMNEGEMDGITCIAKARERVPHLRAVVLSEETGSDSIDKALEAGAVAYVVKSAYRTISRRLCVRRSGARLLRASSERHRFLRVGAPRDARPHTA